MYAIIPQFTNAYVIKIYLYFFLVGRSLNITTESQIFYAFSFKYKYLNYVLQTKQRNL